MIYLNKVTTNATPTASDTLLTGFQRFMNGLSPVSKPTILGARVILPDGMPPVKNAAADNSLKDILTPCTGHKEYSI